MSLFARKKRKTKHVFTMLFVLGMVAGCFSGCGQTQEDSTSSEKVSDKEIVQSEEKVTESEELNITEPITIEIYSKRQDGDTNDANELYIFNYLEHWLADQGYDVTIEATAPPTDDEAQQQLSIMMGTGDLPDMVWYGIDPKDVVTYGMEEKMLLDWTPYLNKETMPNLMALLEEVPDALAASITMDGGVYGLPSFYSVQYDSTSGNYPGSIQFWINKAWLEEAGLDMPKTVDDFIDMLRAFKNHKNADGSDVWSIADFGGFFVPNGLVWGPAGYYGSSGSRYGTSFMIKNEEVYLPAYTEDYRTLVTLFNTMYKEGLLHPDFLTMDQATRRALVENDQFGVFEEHNPMDQLGTDADASVYENWVNCGPLVQNEGDQVTWSLNPTYYINRLYVSADTKYPELLVKIVDHLYSEEGSMIYQYGPMAGKDPYNLIEGWTMDETGTISVPEKYESWWKYRTLMLFPQYNAFSKRYEIAAARKIAGVELEVEYKECTDPITGVTRSLPDYDLTEGFRAYRNKQYEQWDNVMTTVCLPTTYMSAEDSLRAVELQTVIDEYITAESAKFIIGERPLEEVDKFWEELEEIGVEEYIELYREAYAPYMKSVFGD